MQQIAQRNAESCALFNFFSGVHALSDEVHRQGGKQLAQHGYVLAP
jgi:hypothetical protein